MTTTNRIDLGGHLTVLGWLYIAGHAVFLVIGLFVFALLTAIGTVSGDAQAAGILVIIATGVALLMAVLSLPGMLAGYGLLKHRSWGRVLAIVIAVLNLINFPLGTLVGLYALWVLLQQEANEYFDAYTRA